MSEPPEPRRPEEGGGEEDYDASWDDIDADGLLDGLEDDALLDSIRDGVRGDLGPDELTDLLAGLRDVPDKLDIPMKNTSRVERGENVLPPRQTSEGSAPDMTATEDAAALRAAGHTAYEQTLGAINAVEEDVTKLIQTLQLVMQASEESFGVARQRLGEGHENLNDIANARARLGTVVEGAQGIAASINAERTTMQQHAAKLSETFSAAADRIGGGSGS
jgi:hypothetical protein